VKPISPFRLSLAVRRQSPVAALLLPGPPLQPY